MADEDTENVHSHLEDKRKENINSEELFSDKSNVVKVASNPDCPVCLQPCSFPVQLPCQHIFCFLCIKGVALRSRKCALCRHTIPDEFLDNPVLVQVLETKENSSNNNDDWFYEGRNGWWQYDHRTNTEINKAFSNGEKSVELLIAGFVYFIDFENMVQYRRNEPGRKRKIKKDVHDKEKKGVAGIWLGGRRPPLSRNLEQGSVSAVEEGGDQEASYASSDTVAEESGSQNNSHLHPSTNLDESVDDSGSRNAEYHDNMGFMSGENLEDEQRLEEIVESLSSTYL